MADRATKKAAKATAKPTEKKTSARKSTYTISAGDATSKVQVADDVIAAIVALAATEVDGVASIGGGITREKAPKAGARALAKAIKVDVEDDSMSVRAILNLRYGYNIPETCKKVQERVKSALEEMMGMRVSDVAVSVADVTVEKSGTKKRTTRTAKKKK